MRIVFICSSLEPGRDGVGDYTRRLAGELIRQGHECRIVALNDKGRTNAETRKTEKLKRETGQNPNAETQKTENGNEEPISGCQRVSISAFIESQRSEGTEIECLRLPGSLGWSERATLARQWVDAFNPDWVSLQFVPFGFHPKGLCCGLGKKLTAINSKAPWHIMFHELWLGLGEKSSVKHRVWGALQRTIIMDLMNCLRPRVVHTQAEPYRKVLSKNGFEASILPLFGNIPFINGDGWSGLLEPLVTTAAGKHQGRTSLYLAGVFGAVHPEWDAEQAVNVLLPLVRRFQKRLVLVFLGKNNLTPEAVAKFKSALEGRATIFVTGEKTNFEISKILQSLDLGLATSPRQLIQKSGSVTAMLEHGLPVLVARDDWRLRGTDVPMNETSPRIFLPEQFALLEDLPMNDFQMVGDSGIKRVADRLLAALKLSLGGLARS